MWSYIVRRLLLGIPTLLGVTIIILSLLHLAPGDPINAMLPPDAPQEVVEMIREQMGFNKPLPVQYWRWLKRVAGGLRQLHRHPAAGAPICARPSGIRSCWRWLRRAWGSPSASCSAAGAFSQGRWLDKVASATAITGVSLPHYWVAILLIIVFSVELNWLPAMGIQSTGADASAWELARHMVLPTVALSLIPMGVIMRMTRASVLEILSQEFVMTLRAKGLWSRTITRHVVKNAAPPVLTLMGLQFGYLLGGSVLVETVFSWPGSGYLLNLSIFQRDFPVFQGSSWCWRPFSSSSTAGGHPA